MKSPRHIATATYTDTWQGNLAAFLVPQKTTRCGTRVTVYRWMTERGATCDGVAHGHGAACMMRCALYNPFFSNVAANLAAREIFTS
jgi:hypothetical protein